ncbi:twinkle protein [Bradyrhizobium japonicum]|uniref:DnaB-like helicase C-terminal domain-containing protein n=1 Tax=Bradyrhizobium japonicum TaxID=375 RepID=UPI0020A147EA|nr:DnaB-like helicase C-terminal domain-containing protein [Bradyrhizobium japonicum]MCP1937355.1 twinkle protein [Bradyrhizobium japonicum]
MREQDDDFAEKPKKTFTPLKGHYADLTARGISEETCKKCDYQIGETESGKKVHIQLIKDDNGRLIDQKTRDKDKQFAWVGGSKYAGIIGSWSWPAKGKSVVITEGEIDRMSVSQAFDNKWPTGSLPNGASTAKKAILADYDKLCRFDSIILCFDNDEPGQEALKVACDTLPVGKVKIMSLPKKDANAVLMDKTLGPAVLVRAFWDATPYRPDGIREGREFTRERMKQTRKAGLRLVYPKLDEMWDGMRDGEITTICAGSGIGKSTIARDIAYHQRMEHDLKIGNIFLEEDNETSVKAYVGLHAGVPLKKLIKTPEILSDDQWDASLAAVIWDKMMFYDHFGSLESDRLLTMMRYMAASGCRRIVLDHISIVVSGLESADERKDIDVLMTKLASFVKETGVHVVAIVHLKRSNGKNFNEGGQISANDLRGSAAIEQLSFNILAAERNQQDEKKKAFAMLRSLKCRITGETGEADLLKWNLAKGCYEPASAADLAEFDPHDDTEDAAL